MMALRPTPMSSHQQPMERDLKSGEALEQDMKLLFVCVGNTCRSQMAEGLAKSMGFEAASAGTHPGPEVAEHAVNLLNSKGISTDGMVPKGLDGIDPSAFDMVISMGCGVHCPAIKIDDDWALEDPVGQEYEVYEETAAEIERRLKILVSHSS